MNDPQKARQKVRITGMKMDDILLMAYVDGALTSHQREEVDRAIEASAEIATRVALLQASVLPYQRAFQRHPWPPVPQSLSRKVADVAHAHAAICRTKVRPSRYA
ncbi:anti-sigma factor family protein [Burkholderia ambifaria]|uniref:anti-sigma factor family protein n=1 Tax=Burkholderia ambifaria TaxID=152480 RepID=UPI001FC7C404|nr:hypothetical protein [Burkholderia ambifaria]